MKFHPLFPVTELAPQLATESSDFLDSLAQSLDTSIATCFQKPRLSVIVFVDRPNE